MMDCKKALAANNNDMGVATEWLRKKGLASADKKAGRLAAEGVVAAYVHPGSRLGVILEVNCETDFVAVSDKFQQLVSTISMQIAASPTVRTLGGEGGAAGCCCCWLLLPGAPASGRLSQAALAGAQLLPGRSALRPCGCLAHLGAALELERCAITQIRPHLSPISPPPPNPPHRWSTWRLRTSRPRCLSARR
jgi:hypothetical protein